jgi:hypothetical protein
MRSYGDLHDEAGGPRCTLPRLTSKQWVRDIAVSLISSIGKANRSICAFGGASHGRHMMGCKRRLGHRRHPVCTFRRNGSLSEAVTLS